MSIMRAKMTIDTVEQGEGCETLLFRAVGKSDEPYNEDGSGDENNSFARWTPCADLNMTITNPELMGKLKEGQTFYVDFTKAE
jgi:hypothetical protein